MLHVGNSGGLVKRFLLTALFLIVAALASPYDAIAEERLIAVIMANSQPRYQDIQSIFAAQAQSFCGQDCRIYVQKPNADIMSLRNSVRKAVALGADLIVTYGPAATLAAKAETPPVPTLFADVYDPVGLLLVSEKTGVGRNMTGVRGDAPVQALFKYFLEATGADSLAVLYDQASPEGNLQERTLEESGKRRKIRIVPLPVEAEEDHMTVLSTVPAGVDGLFLASSEHAGSQLDAVINLSVEHKLPVITQRPGAAEAGAFMVLESSAEEQGMKLAEMAETLLSGGKVEDIPMYKPRQVAFVINMKIAKAFGITVPFDTLSVATSVVR